MYGFRKKDIGHKTCIVIFSTILSETFLILGRTDQDIKNVQEVFM